MRKIIQKFWIPHSFNLVFFLNAPSINIFFLADSHTQRSNLDVNQESFEGKFAWESKRTFHRHQILFYSSCLYYRHLDIITTYNASYTQKTRKNEIHT